MVRGGRRWQVASSNFGAIDGGRDRDRTCHPYRPRAIGGSLSAAASVPPGVWPTGRLGLLLLEQCRQIVFEEIANAGELDIRRRMPRQLAAIVRVVTLLGKHRRDAFTPDFLDRGQDAQFVIDQDIVIGGVETPYVFQLLLLVDIDE